MADAAYGPRRRGWVRPGVRAVPAGETAARPTAYTIVNRNSGSDDTSRIVSVASGKVLDVADCNSADGTDIRQWSWLNNTCQRFRTVITAGGFVRLQNQATGKVADVANCGTADGTDVRQWTWLNNRCQQWSLNSVT